MFPIQTPPARELVRVGLIAVASALLPACGEVLGFPAGGGGGGVNPPGNVEETRVEAVGMVIAVPEDDALTTSAQLAVFAVGQGGAAYIGGITNPRIATGDEEFELLTTETAGVFATNSVRAPGFDFAPGRTWEFRFTVVDLLGNRADFAQPVSAPTQAHAVEIPNDIVFYAQEPVSLELLGMPEAGAVAVTPAETPKAATWTSFAFGGPAQVTEALNSLLAVDGPAFEIPGTAFPEPGRYRIEVHGYDVARAAEAPEAGRLGASSWFTAGRAVVLELDVL